MDLGLRTALAHILWLGGGARTGKTTLSRLLAGKYDLKIYNLDWHRVREHRERLDPVRHPFSLAWERATMDERWLLPSAEELVERTVASWTEGLGLVIEDLLGLPRSRVVLAEGPGALPWCVAPLLTSPRQAIFLVPTPRFRDAVLSRRLAESTGRAFDDTTDPERASANLRARDLALATRIAESCDALGLRCEEMNGSLDLPAAGALLEEHFRPYLPEVPNV